MIGAACHERAPEEKPNQLEQEELSLLQVILVGAKPSAHTREEPRSRLALLRQAALRSGIAKVAFAEENGAHDVLLIPRCACATAAANVLDRNVFVMARVHDHLSSLWAFVCQLCEIVWLLPPKCHRVLAHAVWRRWTSDGEVALHVGKIPRSLQG